MKKYIANTAVSISVTLPSGGCTRVSFSPLTDGTSVYYTDDEDIQWALEHHYKFGKLFRLAEEQIVPAVKKPVAKKSSKKTTPKAGVKSPSKKGRPGIETDDPVNEKVETMDDEDIDDSSVDDETEDEEDQEDETTLKEVTVSDMDAAKDYLAENYEVVRTKLKTEDIINDTALSLGIVFKFL